MRGGVTQWFYQHQDTEQNMDVSAVVFSASPAYPQRRRYRIITEVNTYSFPFSVWKQANLYWENLGCVTDVHMPTEVQEISVHVTALK